MVKVLAPAFAFRAERNYVHSTDIYETILAELVEAGFGHADGPLRLTIRKIMRNQMKIHFREPGETVSRPPDAVIDFTAHVGGARIDGWFATMGGTIEDRIPYEEEEVIRQLAVIDGLSIRIEGDPQATSIEVVTALAVHLHNTVSPPSAGGKWLATRLDFNRPLQPEDASHLHLEMQKRRDERLTKTVISVPGEELGRIYFSLGTP